MTIAVDFFNSGNVWIQSAHRGCKWSIGGKQRKITNIKIFTFCQIPGHIAQLVMCLATDACPTADPGVTSLIPVQSHTFVEFDHE